MRIPPKRVTNAIWRILPTRWGLPPQIPNLYRYVTADPVNRVDSRADSSHRGGSRHWTTSGLRFRLLERCGLRERVP